MTDPIETLVALYPRVKEVVLIAEELDPAQRSNVSTSKEMRDAFDHLMRFHAEERAAFKRSDSGQYRKTQIEKAIGHVFRVGYDAIDGLVVAARIRLSNGLDGISNDAISEIFPEYYEKQSNFEETCEKIANRRKEKDVGAHTAANLEGYLAEAKELADYCKRALAKVPTMKKWDRVNGRKEIKQRVFMGAIVAIIGGVVVWSLNRLFPAGQAVASPVATAASTTNKGFSTQTGMVASGALTNVPASP